MKIVDCPWELANLDCKVAEISLSNEDKAEEVDAALKNVESEYDYVVVKMPTAAIPFQQLMCDRQYLFMETQITFRKLFEDLNKEIENNKAAKQYLKNSTAKRVETEEELQMLVDSMTPYMFSTDRVFLDPAFGPKYGMRRYRNWIITEFHRGTIVMMHYFRNTFIGFSMGRVRDGEHLGMLSGVFEKYQNAGMGLFLPLLPYYYQEYGDKVYVGKFSTNNTPVVRIHDAYDYDYTDMEYVFVKHIKH